jgi:hypothetical protein
MCDLETLDTVASAKILSIGACTVPWDGVTPIEVFYVVINEESQPDRSESKSTRAFWDSQPPEARTIFGHPDAVSLEQGLLMFRQWLGKLTNWKSTYVWGNGSDFDNAILSHAYASIDVTLPWPFYQSRCFRTVRKDLSHHVGAEPARKGTHHNALDDALYQAEILVMYGKVLGIEGAKGSEPKAWPNSAGA